MGRHSALDDQALFERVWLGGRLEEHLDAVYDVGIRHPAWLEAGTRSSALTYTKIALSRAAGRACRASGRGGGTAAPGRLLLRLAPSAISTLAARLPLGVIAISATNGKTTTARMLAGILEAAGLTVVHNRAGANTNWGVATALAERDGDVGVFEIDEAWLPLLASQLQPRVLVLGNLSRDRLDGYGELERLIALWRDLLGACGDTARIVLNADDPLLSGPAAVMDAMSTRPELFGIADTAVGETRPAHPHDGHSCAACGARLVYARAFVAQLGHYRCPQCGRGRPSPSVSASSITDRGLDGTDVTISVPGGDIAVRLTQPGLHNVYNALAAACSARVLKIDHDSIRRGLTTARPPFGRAEQLLVDGREVHLCLVKNPASVNAVLRLLAGHSNTDPLYLWLALNDGVPDGRDVSWIWDCDYELLDGRVASATCSGRRAHELALRLKYAGWDGELTADPDLATSFSTALRRTPRLLVALPTYTALLGLRPVLNRRGVAVSDWGADARASH
jgi:UDP-N-acetylmuramyl tripeptide synthase